MQVSLHQPIYWLKKNDVRIRLQKGATLFVGLIMLLLTSIVVMSLFYFGKGNLQIEANMQQRNEVLGAAQSTVETAISSTLFFTNPSNIFPVYCQTANTLCIDANADGVPDITVALTPTPSCIKVQAIQNFNLDLSNTEDLGCSIGVQQNYGIAGAVTNNSMCADSVWEITANASDTVTQAQAFVTQGIAVRIPLDSSAVSCP
jgi:Tfp pilus assembly protein PilX